MKIFLLFLFAAFSTQLFAEADLELQSLKALPQDESSEMAITLRMINRGPESAGHLGCNIYVYSNQKLVSSQAFALKPLAADESREDSLRISLTSDPVTRVKAEIFDSGQPDTQPSTNFIQVNLKPPDFRTSDLEIAEASVETSQPVTDKVVVVRLKVRNNGPDIAPFSKITADLLVYNSSVGKTEKRIDRIAAGDEADLKLIIPLSKSITGADGTIHLEWTGSDQQMFDPDKANDSRDILVQLTRRMPDLTVKDIRKDKKGVLTFFIVNKGSAPSEASTAALFLDGALFERYPVPVLQPGADFRIKEVKADMSTTALVTVVADYNADVAEMSEENNKVNSQQ
jgi:CARDB